jgi:homoserine/homoserine lactone efflux protein
MRWDVWVVFFIMETAACFSPGPAVLYVLSQALARGTLASVWANLGILSGNIIYFFLSATGIGAIILASHSVFSAIRWMGAAYLIYLGVTAFAGKSRVLSVAKPDAAPLLGARALLSGMILQLSSPGAIIFFVALLPQFVDPSRSVARQVAILAVTSVCIEFCVLLGYGALAGRATQAASQPRFAKVTNRVSGTMLIVAAARILVMTSA